MTQQQFKVRLTRSAKQFEAAGGVSLLDAARTAGLVLEHGCRTGRCGSCKVQVLDGHTQPCGSDLFLSAAERAQGWVLSCAVAAASDLSLDAADLGELAELPVLTLPARVAALERPAPDVLRLRLRLPPGSALRYLPGQYLQLIGPEGVRRSYSLAAPAAPGEPLELHVRRVPGGRMSEFLFEQAQPGQLLRLVGPYGSFVLREVAGRDLVFLATGTGIAPLKAMLAALMQRPAAQQPRSLELLWGGRTPPDLYWQPPEAPECPAWLRFTPVLSRAEADWRGARGHVQDVLLARRPELRGVAVYACGSPAMIDGARARLLAAGVRPADFHADAFVSA